MKLEDLLAENIDKWKAMVTELGGQWVGVQQGFQDVEPFVLFVAPSSMSPIGIPVSQMTLDNVKQKLGVKITHRKPLKTEDLEEIPEQQVLEFFTQYRDAFLPHANFEALLELARDRAGLYRCLESVIKKNHTRS